MWIMKLSGLTWERAQLALKDGLFVGHSIWHHTTEAGPQRICLDPHWNLCLRPPAPPSRIVVPPGMSPAEFSGIVGKWKPSQPELESDEWIAFAWEEVAKA